MKKISLENENLSIIVNCHGAELCSMKDKKTGKEYLWNADPKFWERTSPILFPFVGGLKDRVYRYNGTEYPMGQHGFARDKEFTLVSQTEDEVWFELTSSEETYVTYPFHFQLEAGYRLEDSTVKVMWKVKNTDDKEMYFSIGGHPAFFCPLHEGEKQWDYYLGFRDGHGNRPDRFNNTLISPKGLALSETKTYELEDGFLPINEHLFDHDALVLENDQVKTISLADADGREYVEVEFDAPLVGVWSPAQKQAPFVCIEPWYGRCDKEDFEGELKDREWGNALEAGAEFTAEYKITVFPENVR